MSATFSLTRIVKVNLCRRSFCVSASSHPYDNVVPFKSNKQLADYLCENILYDNNGIIVVNKPYGISFSRDIPRWKNENTKIKTNLIKHKIEVIQSSPRVTVEEDKINLHDALPYLKANLGCETLSVIKSPEKYTTGVCILGHSEKIRSNVLMCWQRSHSQKIPIDSYLAICSGVPIKPCLNNFSIAIGLDISQNGKRKKAVLKNNYSRNDVLKNKVKVATVDTLLLSTSSDLASLVQLDTNQRNWHFVRLFLASRLLAPAIGDHLFGSRVKKVMGTSVLVDLWSNDASQPQKLNPNLLEKLNLCPGSERYIPTMIHLSEIRLIKFMKKSDLVLQAPPPAHFTWTLDQLKLYLPTNSVSVVKDEPISEKISAVN